ncbi:UTP--glucose-1-phosphate uridylyltransferase GalU [Rufibacter tibetensis]|uniref:UTP--glucose-1-phosphate uridylyltransferase n=1 Tax=Rufibacter tibetensis TaxID=512763 RepID=A0A0N7HXC9_9BACT|nr:UTP--glucose-1-phosphate uridylyltransferase GalU [Rufibacter tibetensis]ALJ01697.1 UTP--glucose-1-phosphate uridylyltransferase [Rufibacter tibetensis]
MIKKAVIPAAGFGTRFLPATKSQPKEMLPIIDTPTIQYVVQEAVDSGIEEILIITGKGKRAIIDHFDRNFELEQRLLEKQEEALYQQIRQISDMANIYYVHQKELNGLGDAVSYGKQFTGNEPFAVLLGDTVMESVIPVTQQLIDIYNQYEGMVIAVEPVPQDKVNRYGIVGGRAIIDSIMEIDQLIEKPELGEAPSNLAIAGRYILTPEIYESIKITPKKKNNEVQLTDAMVNLLGKKKFYSCTIEGKRHDIGSKLDFLKTNIEFALKRKEFAKPLLEYLTQLLEEKKG